MLVAREEALEAGYRQEPKKTFIWVTDRFPQKMPASLSLSGYLGSFGSKNVGIVTIETPTSCSNKGGFHGLALVWVSQYF